MNEDNKMITVSMYLLSIILTPILTALVFYFIKKDKNDPFLEKHFNNLLNLAIHSIIVIVVGVILNILGGIITIFTLGLGIILLTLLNLPILIYGLYLLIMIILGAYKAYNGETEIPYLFKFKH